MEWVYEINIKVLADADADKDVIAYARALSESNWPGLKFDSLQVDAGEHPTKPGIIAETHFLRCALCGRRAELEDPGWNDPDTSTGERDDWICPTCTRDALEGLEHELN